MNKPRALIVEDDSDLLTIFSEALKLDGFEITTAHDGQMAMTRLDEAAPDVVVLDLHLPKVADREVLKRIRTEARLANTKVIVATADARLAEELENKADLILVKAIGFHQLSDLAQRLRPDGPQPDPKR